MSFLLDIYRKEKGFVWTGLIGILLGLVGITFFLIQGNEIPPEGKWTKMFTFNLAIGVFALTTAIVAPYVRMTSKQRKRFSYSLIASFLIGYAIETIQNMRGFDPRFTKEGTLWDIIMGIILGLDSILLMASVVYFMVIIFKQKDPQNHPFHLSLRYAILSNLFGFLSGIWMSLLMGRMTAEGVDIMILHFVGFHGYQAIPLIGWLINQAKSRKSSAVHIGGIAWIGFCFALFLQSALGYPFYQLTSVSLLSAGFLGIYGLAALYSFRQCLNNRKRRKKEIGI